MDKMFNNCTQNTLRPNKQGKIVHHEFQWQEDMARVASWTAEQLSLCIRCERENEQRICRPSEPRVCSSHHQNVLLDEQESLYSPTVCKERCKRCSLFVQVRVLGGGIVCCPGPDIGLPLSRAWPRCSAPWSSERSGWEICGILQSPAPNLRIGLLRIGSLVVGLLRLSLTRIGLLLLSLARVGMLRPGPFPCCRPLLLPVPSVIGVAVIVLTEAASPLGTLRLLLVAHVAEALQRLTSVQLSGFQSLRVFRLCCASQHYIIEEGPVTSHIIRITALLFCRTTCEITSWLIGAGSNDAQGSSRSWVRIKRMSKKLLS